MITDIQMPGISGLELQERHSADGVRLPVIILTGYGDVSGAVRALKRGAIDFVEKPFHPPILIDQVRHAIANDAEMRATAAQKTDFTARLGRLTPREHEVMKLVVSGHANKVIAIDLNIIERTVELHRGRV